jgi:predicted CoA-binding protein
MSKTVLLGATPNPGRYAFFAAERLHKREIPFVPVGIKNGKVLGQPILDLRQKPVIKDVHTITIYIGPNNQKEWEDYIISLNPKRVIFNPGTENPMFMKRLLEEGIEAEAACTLVLLGTGTY